MARKHLRSVFGAAGGGGGGSKGGGAGRGTFLLMLMMVLLLDWARGCLALDRLEFNLFPEEMGATTSVRSTMSMWVGGDGRPVLEAVVLSCTILPCTVTRGFIEVSRSEGICMEQMDVFFSNEETGHVDRILARISSTSRGSQAFT